MERGDGGESVGQCELDGVTHPSADGRAGNRAVEGPNRDYMTLGYLPVGCLGDQFVLSQVIARREIAE